MVNWLDKHPQRETNPLCLFNSGTLSLFIPHLVCTHSFNNIVFLPSLLLTLHFPCQTPPLFLSHSLFPAQVLHEYSQGSYLHCSVLEEAWYTKVTAINLRIALVLVCFLFWGSACVRECGKIDSRRPKRAK